MLLAASKNIFAIFLLNTHGSVILNVTVCTQGMYGSIKSE